MSGTGIGCCGCFSPRVSFRRCGFYRTWHDANSIKLSADGLQELDLSRLLVVTITLHLARTLDRFRARGMGRAALRLRGVRGAPDCSLPRCLHTFQPSLESGPDYRIQRSPARTARRLAHANACKVSADYLDRAGDSVVPERVRCR